MSEAENRRMVERLLDGIDAGNPGVMDDLFHDDSVIEWPASRERLVGAANRRLVYANMPALPRVTRRRIYGSGDLWIAEATLSYSGRPYCAVLIFEFRDGKVARETAYWSEPFTAPAWRSKWVETITE